MLDSDGWRAFVTRFVVPKLGEWRKDLLTNLHLPNEERLGLVRALGALEEGIVAAYQGTGAHMPEWLAQELTTYE